MANTGTSIRSQRKTAPKTQPYDLRRIQNENKNNNPRAQTNFSMHLIIKPSAKWLDIKLSEINQ